MKNYIKFLFLFFTVSQFSQDFKSNQIIVHDLLSNSKLKLCNMNIVMTENLNESMYSLHGNNKFLTQEAINDYENYIFYTKDSNLFFWKLNYENYPVTKVFQIKDSTAFYIGTFNAIENREESSDYDLNSFSYSIVNNELLISFNKNMLLMNEEWEWSELIVGQKIVFKLK